MKKILPIFVSISILIIAFFFAYRLVISFLSKETLGETSDDYLGSRLGDKDIITCTFERTIEVANENGKIFHKSPHKESNPLIMTFVGLTTENPRLKGIGSQDTSYESNLVVLSDNSEKITLGESTSVQGNVFIYSIYKEKGVGIWTKHYSFAGIPLGVISMGKCQ